MMFNLPNQDPKAESNAKAISPDELKALLEQGKFAVNLIGANQQLNPTALVIHGIVHALPLNFGWHHVLEKKYAKDSRENFTARMNQKFRRDHAFN